jgi:hypothetical protein
MALTGRATHVLQWAVQREAKPRGGANLKKAVRSPDWSLQLDSMKLESLVIADQNAAVNTFPGLVHTARHTMGVGCTRSRQANREEAAYHGVVHDWGEVVTR